MKYRYLLAILFLTIFSQLKSQNSIFWGITSPNGTTSYLLGTCHTLGNHFVDSLPLIKEKLTESKLAIFECIDGDKTIYDSIVMARKDNYDYLDELDSNYILKLDSMSKNWEYPISKLKPYELIILLQNKYTISHCNNVLPSDTWNHFDNYLLHLAKENNIDFYGLETNLDQIKIFKKTLPNKKWSDISFQIHDLIDAVLKEEDSDYYCSYVRKYRQLKNHYYFESECDNFLKNKTRNKKWMKILPKKLESTSCFIAVGLAHLKNECGLINQLRELGFIVAPISLNHLTN